MEYELNSLPVSERYFLLVGAVVPRPIAWVSSLDDEGRPNLAPFSFFNAIGSNPPAVCVAISHQRVGPDPKKDTLRNILATGEFVVNIADWPLLEKLNQTAATYGPEVNEFEVAGLTPAPAHSVAPARVAEAPIHLECKLHQTVPLGEGPGSSTLVIGLVEHLHVADRVLDDTGRIDPQKLQPIARLNGPVYAKIGEPIRLPVPAVEPPTQD